MVEDENLQYVLQIPVQNFSRIKFSSVVKNNLQVYLYYTLIEGKKMVCVMLIHFANIEAKVYKTAKKINLL
jgi:hypothetical protein